MDKEYSVTIDGESVIFEFKDSLIHGEGEATGNIDAIITTKPPLPQNLLLDELHIKIPGTDELLYIYGFGVVENSLKATFNSSLHVDKKNLPESVEVYWGANGEQLIGEMCCRLYSENSEHDLAVELEETEPEDDTNNDKAPKPDNKNTNQQSSVPIITTTKNKNPLKIITIVILIVVVVHIIYFVVA
ncbi:MAG: hypothetical protein ACI85N_000446 [Gammaproteobacteria bacterium]|jgi:hypothetical protein